MALDQEKIRRAFRARLYTVPPELLPDQDHNIAYENRAFTPPNPEPPQCWVRETFLAGSETLAATNMLELVGSVIYDVFYPVGKGTELPAQLARAIVDACKPTTTVSREGDPQIEIQNATAQNGREDEQYDQSWWRVPVWINFRAYGPNEVTG